MAFPSNAQYTPVLVGGTPLFDALGDESPVSTDIVGNSTFPAGFFAYDGTNVYFRLRLNGDPRNNQLTGFRNFAWGVLINTTGVAGTYDWLFNVDGLNNRVSLIQNTVKLVNSWNDPAEGTGGGNPNFAQPITNFDFARVTPADSSIGGDQDFFLDWFLPANTVFSFLGINASSAIRAIYFSSANANNYNKDSLRTSEGFSFANAFTDPVTPDQADIRARLATNKVRNSGPATVVLGQQATWTGTVTVTNTGRSQATSVFLDDIIGPDQVNSFVVNTTSQGLTSYNPATKLLTWNVGNLNPGITATLTFTLNGAFTSSGSRNLDRVQATGFDSSSGNAIQSNTSVVTINVQQTATINGTITDQSTGLVLPNTTVSLLQGMSIIATTQSNASGFYTFTNVVPGNYTVQAARTNYVTGTANVSAVGGTSTTADIALVPQPSTISGNVSNGGSINNATVQLLNNSGTVVATTTTNVAGNYSFVNVTPGLYNVTVLASGFQSQTKSVMTEPNQAAVVNFILIANPGSISGTVRDSTNNTAIALANVELLDSNGIPIASTTANGSGQYSFNNLAPGNYQVRSFASNYSTTTVSSTVTAGNITNTNIFLEPNPGSIQGSVIDSETTSAITGASVQAVNSQNVIVASTTTNGSGQYSLSSLLPGSYSLIFTANGYATQTLGAVVTSNAVTIVDAALLKLAGALIGTVQDPNAVAIPGATVTVFQNNIQVGSVITDSNGNYMVSGLPPGSYTVVVSAPNYTTESVAAMIENGQTTTVNVTLNEDPGTLTGFVRDTNNVPIPGGSVIVQISTGAGIIVATTVTAPDGSYTVPNLAPGNYTVVAAASNFQAATQGVTISSNTTSIVNFNLASDPGSISGIVTNAQTGTPIIGANVQVRVVDSSGAVIATVLTDENGQYVVNGLAPGIYTVVVSAQDFQTNAATIQVISNQATDGSIALQPDPGQITGTVVDSVGSNPIPGASVSIVNSSGNLITTVLTDTNGVFMVEGLAPDNYTVNVFANNFQNGMVGALVSSGQTTPVSVSLEPNPGFITGTVIPQVPNTVVQLRDVNNVLIDSVVANQDGTFSFNNLTPGIYTVLASAPNYSTAQAGVSVLANQTSTVDLTLVPNPGSVSGIVTDNLGNPIVNAIVQIFDQNNILIGSGFTDSSGQYIVGNLPSGSFNVVVNSPGFGQVITGINLGVGEDLTGVNISLIPNPGIIDGQITNFTTGDTIAGATVVIIDGISQIPVATTTTSAFGNYSVSGLSPGSYIVSASKMNFTTEQIGAIVISDSATRADLALGENPGMISGNVEDTNGNPITGNGIQISVFNENNVLVVSFLANSDGTYSVPSLAPGTYFITASAPNYSSSTVSAIVESNQTTTVTNVLAANPVTLTVQVVIENTLTPIEGSAVTIRHSNNIVIATGITDGNGIVTFFSLPTGTLNITADASSFGTDTKSVIGGPGDSLSAVLSLAPNPGQIQGLVSNLASGEAIPNAVIQLYDITNVLVQTTLSNQNGAYAFSGVTPGVYTVIANATDFGPETAGAIVTSNQTSFLSFALSPNPGIVQGYVRDSVTLDPIVGATVVVRELSGTGPVIFTTITDSDGFFQTTTLSPRVYVLVGSSPDFGSNSVSAEVMSGGVTNVEILLTPNPGALTGTVRDAQTLQPLTDTLVRVINNQGTIVATVQTSIDGTYFIPGLTEGSYTVSAINTGYQSLLQQVNILPNSTIVLDFNLLANPATLSGTVVDTITGSPLTGVIIEVYVSGTDILVRRVLTDENGNYLIEGLPQGTFDVKAQLQDYAISVNTVFLSPGESEELNIALVPFPATVQGTIRDAVTLDPISGALIKVVIPNTDIVVGSIITSSDGTYSIGNLPSGSYNVVISADGYATEVIPVILAPNGTETVNADLDPNPAGITGFVLNAQTTTGIQGALVRVFNSDGVFITSTLTDDNGLYAIPGLAQGQYTVIASADGFGEQIAIVTLSPGETESLNFSLSNQTATLRGTVRDAVSNQPIQSALVQVFRIGTSIPVASVLTDGSGEYEFTGLDPREYRVVFSADGYTSEVFRVFLTNGEVQTLNAELGRRPATIRGRVTDANTGEPIQSAGVITVISGSGIIVASTLTDQEGNYILTGLSAGDYNVIFSADGYVSQTVMIRLSTGEMAIINAALESNPATLTGFVRDAATLSPIENALIQVFKPDGTLIGTTLSDMNGNYTISGLPGGTLVIIARATGYQSQLQPVTLTPGTTSTLNFLLADNPGSVSGTVTDIQTGEPISQVLVQIFPVGSLVPIRSTLTDPDGFYILTGLPPGTYVIRFTASGYPVKEVTIVLAEGENRLLNVQLGEVIPPPPSNLRPECISVEKVYDWVIATHNSTQAFGLSPDCRKLVNGLLERGEGIDIQCQLDPSVSPGCSLISFERGTPGTVEIRGEVKLLVTLSSRTDNAETCTMEVPVSFDKIVAVCLPEGMDAGNVNCSIVDFKCREKGVILTRDQAKIPFIACLEIEILQPVTLEVLGEFCRPRTVVERVKEDEDLC
ncbi:carboxypeptidase regulatory-like domain-containing protein [Rossellomorea sp. KS-H15a]|uniref:carboxypeptidase regulatory-like domain-containing protein n=1 Tax=Rossellomorea sp. KS-H15a TaxID=2963940 RepID=UPI0020C6DAA5|nr:carboxypeptidase regulatory-like domain-containing protein [Rossellomorea sp. KS-H15a]UTE75620.1 carboxypeptidase regulatory-like domain-containing protein [Rossellomorea sp. KS-H15a]